MKTLGGWGKWAVVAGFALMIGLLWRPAVAGDGELFFAPLHDIVFSHNLDLGDELRYFRTHYGGHSDYLNDAQGGRVAYPMVGSALIALPLYMLTHLVYATIQALGYPVFADGLGFAYQYSYTFTAAIAVVGGLWLVERSLRKHFDPATSRMAVGAILLTTPLWYYQVLEPSMSHAFGFFACALLVWALEIGSRAAQVTAGVLAVLTRWSLVLVLAIVPLFRKVSLRAVVVLVGVLAVALVVASGTTALTWLTEFVQVPRYSLQVLFSPSHGILATPILFVAIGGLFFKGSRRYLPPIMAMVILSSATAAWGGGYSYGARRLVDFLPLLAFGLAEVFSRIKARRELTTGLTLMALLNFCWMSIEFNGGRARLQTIPEAVHSLWVNTLPSIWTVVSTGFIYQQLGQGPGANPTTYAAALLTVPAFATALIGIWWLGRGRKTKRSNGKS